SKASPCLKVAFQAELGSVSPGIARDRQLAGREGVGIARGKHIKVLTGHHPPATITDFAIKDDGRKAVALRQQVVLQGEHGKSPWGPGPPLRPLEGGVHHALLG
ncbi:MAG: hypothetical protein ACK55I_36805, partial [bacterium]